MTDRSGSISSDFDYTQIFLLTFARWCATCYDPKRTNKLKNLEKLSDAGLLYLPTEEELALPESSTSKDQSIKVFNGFCVENCLVGEMMAGAGSMGMWA